MVNASKSKGNEFLKLDMRLVRDILYLFVEEVGEYHSLDTKELVWILKKKGYGRDKVRKTLAVMRDAGILMVKMQPIRRKRVYRWRVSMSWVYLKGFFRVVNQWNETPPLFNYLRRAFNTEKSVSRRE